MQQLLRISPKEFEVWVAGYFRAKGFRAVDVVGGAGDLGVDIRCRDAQNRLVVIQCKRYQPTSKISSPDIQKFFGMMVHHNAGRGIFVTTSTYTRPARELALARNIELIEGAQLEHYLNEQNRERIAQEAAARHQKSEVERLAKLRAQKLHQKYGDYHVDGYPEGQRLSKLPRTTPPTPLEIRKSKTPTNYQVYASNLREREENRQRSNAVKRQNNEGTGFIVFGILLLAVTVGLVIFSL